MFRQKPKTLCSRSLSLLCLSSVLSKYPNPLCEHYTRHLSFCLISFSNVLVRSALGSVVAYRNAVDVAVCYFAERTWEYSFAAGIIVSYVNLYLAFPSALTLYRLVLRTKAHVQARTLGPNAVICGIFRAFVAVLTEIRHNWIQHATTIG